jgi:plastocyanin
MKFRTHSLPAIVSAGLFAVSLLTTACSGNKSTNSPPPGPQPSHLVIINNLAFSPPVDTVSVGDTVTWRNDQNIAHTVTSDQGTELQSPQLSQGQTYAHRFTAAGAYPYHCTIHTTMHGLIVVIPAQVSHSVNINNFAYVPASITVSIGDTLTWTNNDAAQHTVTSDTGTELQSPLMNQGQIYKHAFSAAGVFPYHCTLHPTMQGSVTVQ